MPKELEFINGEVREVMTCPECGSTDIDTEGDVVVCDDCGAYWEL